MDVRCDAIDRTFDRVYGPAKEIERHKVKKATRKEKNYSKARKMIEWGAEDVSGDGIFDRIE